MKSHLITPTSLLRTLLLQRLRWRLLILGISLFSAVLGILAPFTQKRFIDGIMSGGPTLKWIWVAFALTFSAQALFQLGIWLATREALYSNKALGDFAYQRILEGPGGLVGTGPAGEAVSLFAVDVPGAASILDQALVMASAMIFPILLAPIALHEFFGIPWLGSIGAIVALSSVNFVLARRQSLFFYSFKALAAERTGLVSEWIQNIRTLRILGWIESAEEKIFAVRRRETENRKKMVTNGQIMNALSSSATYGLNALAILYLVNFRGSTKPTAGELLSLLWILGVFLARPLRQLPWSFVIFMDAISSMKRLEKAYTLPLSKPSSHGTQAIQDLTGKVPNYFEFNFTGLNLHLNEKHLLKNIALDIPRGQLIAIVGEVGSGKSLLLQSIMGATSAKFETFKCGESSILTPHDPLFRSKIAYVPQDGFTMSASLRENVKLSYLDSHVSSNTTEDLRASTSLNAAQFNTQTERVLQHDGLNTEIGERGVNLSGGQRQRIGLARAHFANRPVILMDDCLSAVDVDTEKQLISDLICGEWLGQTRILVTHRMAILPHCDQVLFMENGEISLRGTFSVLLKESPRFCEFVRREAPVIVTPSPEQSRAEGVISHE